MNKFARFAVWYSSTAACLPDNEEPEFIGTLGECQAWVEAVDPSYARPWVTGDIYGLSMEEYGYWIETL